MIVLLIGVFTFMFVCMAALYIAFAVLMFGAAAATFDQALHRDLKPGEFPPAMPRT